MGMAPRFVWTPAVGQAGIHTLVFRGENGRDVAPPPPPNDDLDHATVVETLPFSETLDTRSDYFNLVSVRSVFSGPGASIGPLNCGAYGPPSTGAWNRSPSTLPAPSRPAWHAPERRRGRPG